MIASRTRAVRKSVFAGVGIATTALVTLVAVAFRYPAPTPVVEPAPPAAAMAVSNSHPGFLYGRITTTDDSVYEGRLRWGGTQEAFWSDLFDGAKADNPWADFAGRKASPLELFGVVIGGRDRRFDRRFVSRFGDIARIEAQLRTVRVTLKSGTTIELDRTAAGDMDDGIRVWDPRRGVLDLDARAVRTIAFLPTGPIAGVPDRLHGTVRSRQGDFAGYIVWNQQDYVGTDTLDGRADGKDVRVPYHTIRSIARRSDTAVVALLDGRRVVLSDSGEAGPGNRGVYVDDERYGRVLVEWRAFEGLEFDRGDSGPGYDTFPAGRALAGRVTTADGSHLIGRLVFDLDESETSDTLEGALDGVSFNIPFSAVASIVPPGRDERDTEHARVVLRSGENLQLHRRSDLSDGNGGVLVFVNGRPQPNRVLWKDVARIEFDPAM